MINRPDLAGGLLMRMTHARRRRRFMVLAGVLLALGFTAVASVVLPETSQPVGIGVRDIAAALVLAALSALAWLAA